MGDNRCLEKAQIGEKPHQEVALTRGATHMDKESGITILL